MCALSDTGVATAAERKALAARLRVAMEPANGQSYNKRSSTGGVRFVAFDLQAALTLRTFQDEALRNGFPSAPLALPPAFSDDVDTAMARLRSACEG